MSDFQSGIRFFMGANTPSGFFGYLEDLYSAAEGWRVFLIKSGPGTGKSSLMRRLAQRMAEQGESVEEIHCSSDPRSLDGVIFRDSRQCVLDATAPHIMEPQYWDAVESIVPLDTCIHKDMVESFQTEVIALTDACAEHHRRCRRFLGAAASLLSDSWRIADQCTDHEKIRDSAARFSAREFGTEQRPGGREWRRFLSAVTPEGLTVFQETLGALCPRIVSIEDEQGAVAPVFLEVARDRAIAAGFSVFSCYCPLCPARLEHLLVPEAGLALTLSNSYHKADFPVYRRIHAARFTDMDALREHRRRLAFHRRAIRELLNEAITAVADAKALHDEMESFYSPAMDWEAVRNEEERVWRQLCKGMNTEPST